MTTAETEDHAPILVTPEQILEEWITDLETTDLPQITGRLMDTVYEDGEPVNGLPVGYCCLGILCLVAERHGLVTRVGAESDHFQTARHVPWDTGYKGGPEDGSDTELPVILADWLGVGDVNPYLDGAGAVDRNDNRHESFATIAEHARRQYAHRLTTTEETTDAH